MACPSKMGGQELEFVGNGNFAVLPQLQIHRTSIARIPYFHVPNIVQIKLILKQFKRSLLLRGHRFTNNP